MDVIRKIISSITLIIASFLFYNCGTGPWFIAKNKLKVYRLPIYDGDSYLDLNYDGFYVETNSLPKDVHVRKVIIFNENGYCFDLHFDQSNSIQDIKNKIEGIDNFNLEYMNWYMVRNDTIVIQHFLKSDLEMTTGTLNYSGKILNSGELIITENNGVKRYEFVESDNISSVINGIYLKKKWYKENLHPERKALRDN